jgi:predicted transcriptional regulator
VGNKTLSCPHGGINAFKFRCISIRIVKVRLLKEEQFKILKTMSEATNRMDLNVFAQAVNLSPDQAIAEVQELTKKGFLRKVGKGYGLTAKGKSALKVFQLTPIEMSFQFYEAVDKPLGFTARSLGEFYRLIKQVCSDSLEFHLHRGDFERWLSDVCGNQKLAQEIAALKTADLKGEELRKTLLKIIDAKCGIAELL